VKNETLKKDALAIKERLDQAWSASAYYLLICMGCGILGMVLMIGIHQQYDSVSKLAEWLWFFNQPLRTKKIFLVVFSHY